MSRVPVAGPVARQLGRKAAPYFFKRPFVAGFTAGVVAAGSVELWRYFAGGAMGSGGYDRCASSNPEQAFTTNGGMTCPFNSSSNLAFEYPLTGAPSGRPAQVNAYMVFQHPHPTLGANWANYRRAARYVRTVTAGRPFSAAYPPVWLAANNTAAIPQPVPKPRARPPAIPWAPESSVGGQPAWAGAVPGTGAGAGSSATGSRITYTPTGTPRVRPIPAVRAVPAANTLEKKARVDPRIAALIKAFNAATEYCDMIGALFSALPAAFRMAAGGAQANCMQKQQAVVQHWASMDIRKALTNIVWQNFTDEIWAKLGLPTGEAGLPYGANAPVNVGLSKALGGDVDAAIEALGEAFNAGLERMKLD